jgi:hypothetical protein
LSTYNPSVPFFSHCSQVQQKRIIDNFFFHECTNREASEYEAKPSKLKFETNPSSKTIEKTQIASRSLFG